MSASPDSSRSPKAPNEAGDKAVEARQPEEQHPPIAVAGAASDLEGAVGTKNRAHFGSNPDAEVDPDGDTRSGQNPPNERSQRPEEGGDYPPASKSQAALKHSGTSHDGLAGRVEMALDDETPATDSEPGSAA